jgi:hypothetical protein
MWLANETATTPLCRDEVTKAETSVYKTLSRFTQRYTDSAGNEELHYITEGQDSIPGRESFTSHSHGQQFQ